MIDIIGLSGGRIASRLGRVTKDQVADAFIAALDTELFQNRFSLFTLKLFFGAVDPAAGNAQILCCIHQLPMTRLPS